MIEKLNKILLENDSKHWSFAIRRDADLMTWISQQTTDLSDTCSFPERVYCAIHDERPDCQHGNKRKLKTIHHGWGYCGMTGKCQCAREQISKKVSDQKQSLSESEKAEIQSKREQTNLSVYGHVNTGQTNKAKDSHKAFYADADNIRNQLRKHADTMLERHSVENAAHIRPSVEKREESLKQKYGVTNPMQNIEIMKRSLATRLENGYCEDYYFRNYEKLKSRLLDDFGMILITSYQDYEGSASRPLLNMKCAACQRDIDWRLSHRTPRCLVCNPRANRYKSKPELEILQYVRDLGIEDVVSGDKSIINPFEMDILSRDHKIGIEHSGLWWHSESVRPDKNYHLTKLKKMEDKGYRLFTIFGDEWLNHPDIVKSKLSHLFGKISHRYFARKLKITEIDTRTASAFYDASHIQGAVKGASHHLALSDDDRIIGAMSFATARASKGLPDHSYDLVRFATLPFSMIVGGASKLFAHFVRGWNPAAVISYADRRWSDGGLYHQLGFQLERTNRPSYHYLDKTHVHRYFRFNFRKDVLNEILGESSETEWERMKGLGYDRIWDCGSYRFVWRS